MKRHRTKCHACGRVFRVRYTLGRAYRVLFSPDVWCRPCLRPRLAVAG